VGRLLPLLALLALAACGGAGGDSAADFEGTQRAVAQTVEDLEDAGQDDDPRRICNSLLSSEVVRQIESRGTDCVEAIDQALAQTDSFSLTVTSVRVSGTTASARVETGTDEEEEEVIELVREGRTWRINGLPGTA
jgi:hypothetical protein